MAETIKLDTPAQLLALLPHMLGYRPQNCITVSCLGPKRNTDATSGLSGTGLISGTESMPGTDSASNGASGGQSKTAADLPSGRLFLHSTAIISDPETMDPCRTVSKILFLLREAQTTALIVNYYGSDLRSMCENVLFEKFLRILCTDLTEKQELKLISPNFLLDIYLTDFKNRVSWEEICAARSSIRETRENCFPKKEEYANYFHPYCEPEEYGFLSALPHNPNRGLPSKSSVSPAGEALYCEEKAAGAAAARISVMCKSMGGRQLPNVSLWEKVLRDEYEGFPNMGEVPKNPADEKSVAELAAGLGSHFLRDCILLFAVNREVEKISEIDTDSVCFLLEQAAGQKPAPERIFRVIEKLKRINRYLPKGDGSGYAAVAYLYWWLGMNEGAELNVLRSLAEEKNNSLANLLLRTIESQIPPPCFDLCGKGEKNG